MKIPYGESREVWCEWDTMKWKRRFPLAAARSERDLEVTAHSATLFERRRKRQQNKGLEKDRSRHGYSQDGHP